MRTLAIERRAHGVALVTMSRLAVFNGFDEATFADPYLARRVKDPLAAPGAPGR